MKLNALIGEFGCGNSKLTCKMIKDVFRFSTHKEIDKELNGWNLVAL